MSDKPKKGRPTAYTEEIGEKICLEIATSSKGLATICKQEGFPCTTSVYKWLGMKEHKDFTELYARAKVYQAHFMGGEIIEIADNSVGDVVRNEKGDYIMDGEFARRSQIKIDARKWLMSKLASKVYGDKLDLTTKGGKIETASINLTHPDGKVDLSE